MRWKASVTKANYETGATRTRRVFALKPTYVNGEIVFLGFFEILEMYEVKIVQALVDGVLTSFKIAQWVEISRR